MTSRGKIVKDTARSESQPRPRHPNNLKNAKSRQAYNIHHEGEDDCTVFSMRENLMRNASSIYQDRLLIQEKVQPRTKKKVNRKLNNNSALLDLDRSGYSNHPANNSTRNISYQGNNSFLENESIGYHNVPIQEKKPKILIHRKEERHNSNIQLDTSHTKAPTRFTAQSQPTFDEAVDDEPIFPIIERNRKTSTKQRHNISGVLLNEGNSFEYSSYKEPKLSTRPLSSYRNGIDLKLRNKILSDQDQLTRRKIERPGRYLDPIVNDLTVHMGSQFEPGAFSSNNIVNSRKAINRSIGDTRTNKSSEGEFFPRLNMKNLDTESYRINPYQSQISAANVRQQINPVSSRYSTRKSRNLSHLDITAPARSSSVQKETARQKSQPAIENTKPTPVSSSKTSNLLKKITKDQNSSVKQDLVVNKNSNTGSINETPALKSNRSQKSSRLELNTTIKTPVLRYSGVVLDSNRLIRGQYRVKNQSMLSLR